MGIKDRLKQIGKYLLIKRPASRFDPNGQLSNLEASGEKLVARLAGCKDSMVNRIQLRHLIGIERWTQKRLKVFKGAAIEQDEPEMYMPNRDLSWEELRRRFRKNRDETIRLIEEINSGTSVVQTVFHNEFGRLSLNEWVYFLAMQTNMASRRFE